MTRLIFVWHNRCGYTRFQSHIYILGLNPVSKHTVKNEISYNQGYEHGKRNLKEIHTTTNRRWLTYNGLVEPATKKELSLVWQMFMSAKAVSCADICVWVACILKFGLGSHVVWIVYLICRIPFKRSLQWRKYSSRENPVRPQRS